MSKPTKYILEEIEIEIEVPDGWRVSRVLCYGGSGVQTSDANWLRAGEKLHTMVRTGRTSHIVTIRPTEVTT